MPASSRGPGSLVEVVAVIRNAPPAPSRRGRRNVAGADAASRAEQLGGRVLAESGRIGPGDVRPLRPGVAEELEHVGLGVAGRVDDAEAHVLPDRGLEDRRLGIGAADPAVVEELVELRELAGPEVGPVPGQRRVRQPAGAEPERLGAVVDRLLTAVLRIVVDVQVGHHFAAANGGDVVLDDRRIGNDLNEESDELTNAEARVVGDES